MDLFKPRAASAPRRPTDDNQFYGNIVNQPRFDRFGGLKNATSLKGKTRLQVQRPGDGDRKSTRLNSSHT